MIKKIFDKHETAICMLMIVLYVVINSYCVNNFGVADYRSTIINTAFSVLLLILIIALKGWSYYGLTRGVVNPKKYLYFIPLLLIVSVNLWNGININNSLKEIVFYILTMINIGFIEEIIFRGFLFRLMAKDNVKTAMAISSITFGVGHIVNLFNGAQMLETLLQICYAVSIGYLFVVIFCKSKSLVPCIIAHSLNNALSVFGIENSLSLYIAPLFLIIAPLCFAIYINKTIKD